MLCHTSIDGWHAQAEGAGMSLDTGGAWRRFAWPWHPVGPHPSFDGSQSTKFVLSKVVRNSPFGVLGA